jgi:hypothetical protein
MTAEEVRQLDFCCEVNIITRAELVRKCLADEYLRIKHFAENERKQPTPAKKTAASNTAAT